MAGKGAVDSRRCRAGGSNLAGLETEVKPSSSKYEKIVVTCSSDLPSSLPNHESRAFPRKPISNEGLNFPGFIDLFNVHPAPPVFVLPMKAKAN
ncbi:uncharacterized protein J3R85_016016 [Psidium guajava]|nr:uncharacterized protein J3R85_016016 [Psidium guajava]